MSEHESRVWGIHAGRTGDADAQFLKKSVIALGWRAVGDLSILKADREAFKAAVAKHFPHFKPGAIPTSAGQLYRFVHEMAEGDLIVYPSKRDRNVHIGRVAGPYRFDAGFAAYETEGEGYPNVRPVKWLVAVPRGTFTQGALYEIGSAMSFFQVKTYADEFRAAAEGKSVKLESKAEPKDDPTVKWVAEEIEENTRDFVLKKIAQELKGHPLSAFVAHLLETMGYRTRVSPEGPDGGIDVIAHKDELGFEPPIIKVQVKSGEGSVGDPVVASLYGKVGANDYGLFVTLGTFTSHARNFERGKSNLRLIDGDELVNLVFEHYEQLDPRYKGLIPLKRVYVPEPIDEEGDA
jgi:restriction system protein